MARFTAQVRKLPAIVAHLRANKAIVKDILEEVLANNHRYKPEPLLSKTGVGSLSSASIEERAQEEARSTARIQRAMQRLKQSGASSSSKSDPSPKR